MDPTGLAPVAATRDALFHALALAERARPTAEVQALRASTWGPGWMDVLGLSTPLAAQWTASRTRAVAGIVASLAALDEAERRGELVGRDLGRRVYALVASALIQARVLVAVRHGLRWSPDLLGGEQRLGCPVGLEETRMAVLTATHGRRPVLPLPLALVAK